MNLKEYVKKVEWTLIDYDWVYWSQCVDLIKNYTATVLNIRLWTFWGSAKTGWENKSNTFDPDIWEKIENNFNDPEQIPKEWDIIFFWNWKYWHVAIVLESYVWVNRLLILDQNTWNGDWFWQDDIIKVQHTTYWNVLGWYSLKDEVSEEYLYELIWNLNIIISNLKTENQELKDKINNSIKLLSK